jgi:hypothetical protein
MSLSDKLIWMAWACEHLGFYERAQEYYDLALLTGLNEAKMARA